jgi:hypothetical protein
VESPADATNIYTFIKKDLFHAFYMILTSLGHGACPAYLHALRDHIMHWDPEYRGAADQTCHETHL